MSLGITVSVSDSLFRGGQFIRTLNGELQSYNHTIAASGGYQKATFSIAGSIGDIEEWFEDGLGRDITAYDEMGAVIWNGFVDKVSISMGGRSITYGPLMDISNRVYVYYAPLDTSIQPPAVGNQTYSPAAYDAASIAKYGALYTIISADRVTTANALAIRNTYLAEHKDPEQGETLSLESGSPSIGVECRGYVDYLGRYFYTSAATGTVTLSSKIQTVLAANPNIAIFSTDYSGIATNTMMTPNAEAIAKGSDVIAGEVAKGNASNQRYLFGVYQNRKSFYGPIPTTFAYQFRLSDQRFENFGGGEIMPWDILPGKWLLYADFMAGKNVPAAVRTDPRALFIEEITFTAPRGISITGGKVTRLPQLMARLGLGGGV